MAFQRWSPDGRAGGPHGQMYVRFGDKNYMFMSTKFLQKATDTTKREMRFEIQVDDKARAFGIKFCAEGGFGVTHVPGVVGMSEFCNKYHPKMGKRLHLKWNEEHGMWVGSLDGRAI